MIEDRERFDRYCLALGIENVFWGIGETGGFAKVLPFRFPLARRCYRANDVKWVDWLSQRYPHIADPAGTIAYIEEAFNEVCDAFEPDVFVSWNRYDPTFGIPFEIAKRRGIAVRDLERALVPHFLTLGLNLKETKRSFDSFHYQHGKVILEQFPTANIYPQRRRALKGKQKATVLVLGSWDEVVDRSHCCFASSSDMAKYVQDNLANWRVLYKPHPLGRRQPKLKNVTYGNPIDLIESADVVLTYGSKLELDVVNMQKPLVLANCGLLASSGAANTAMTAEECIEAIRGVSDWHDPTKAKKNLYGYIGYKATHDWYCLQESSPYVMPLTALLAELTRDVVARKKGGLCDAFFKYIHVAEDRKAEEALNNVSLKELGKYATKRLLRIARLPK